MSRVALQLKAAAEPPYWVLSPPFIAGMAFLRLTRPKDPAMQWHFADPFDAAIVMVKKPGGSWHGVTDTRCDCIGFRYKGTCYHRRAVAMCGGVDHCRMLIERLCK